MKLFFRVVPLVLLPFSVSAQDANTKVTNPPASVSQIQDVTNNAEIKLPELTEEDLKNLDIMDNFYKIYGDYSYASKERFIRGLQNDTKTIKEDAENDPTLTADEKEAARIYPRNIPFSRLVVQGGSAAEVRRRVRQKAEPRIDTFLSDMGVDPNTVKKKDNGNGKKSVTKPKLEEHGKAARAVKKSLERDLPEGKCLAFTDGFNSNVIAAIKAGKLEAGIKVVDVKKPAEPAKEKGKIK